MLLLMLLLDEQRCVQSDDHTRKLFHQLTIDSSHRIILQPSSIILGELWTLALHSATRVRCISVADAESGWIELL